MTSFYTEQELAALGFKHCGKNVSISRKASFYGAERMSIGDYARIDDFCILSGSITLGKYAHICASTLLFAGDAGIVLEDYVGISSRCAVYAISDDYLGTGMGISTVPMEYRNLTAARVVFRKHALVGTGCTVLPGVEIAEGTSVGSMSFLNHSTEPWSVYYGIPARKYCDRKRDMLNVCRQFEESRKIQSE